MELYFSLPSRIRTTLAVVVMLAGIGLCVAGYFDRPSETEFQTNDGRVMVVEEGGGRGPAAEFRVGMVMTLVGTVLFLMCGKSRAEKAGYNF